MSFRPRRRITVMTTHSSQGSSRIGKGDEDHIASETYEERSRLVRLLRPLSDEQWSTPSLCDGWQVREVVAHMTMPYRMRLPRFFFGLLRHRFRFDEFADHAAKADTERLTDGDLLAALEDNVRNPWRPPGGGAIGALSHDVIHGLDITEALDLPPAPAERIRLVLENSGPKNFDYFGVDLTGHRFVCSDTDWRLGSGRFEHRMKAKDLLLTVTSRLPLPSL